MLNRSIFFAKARQSVFKGRLTASQKQGMDYILDVWEKDFRSRTSIPQLAYCLGTAAWETAHTMQPIKERGGNAYYLKMYDIRGSRPKKARELGNVNPGDGAKFPGMGFVQSTGRSNARKATKRLRELGLIDHTVDFEKNPELLMVPRFAAMVMFIGMEEGWFTGRTLDKIIDDDVDGDEHGDFVRARAIINGTDKAEAIADLSDSFLEALVAATAEADLTEEDREIAGNKSITKALSIDDADAEDVLPEKSAAKEIRLNKFEVKGVQTQLYNLGYVMVGKLDGIWGTDTSAAITALQKQVGLPITGGYNEDVKAALNDKKNKYVPSKARQATTAATVRASGSKTIKATDAIKSTSTITTVGLLATSAGSAVVEYGGDAVSWIRTIKETFDFIPVWVWPLLFVVVCIILWKQGHKAEEARVEDERRGIHRGLPVVLDDDDEVDINSVDAEPVPKFLRRRGEEELKEREEG